MDQEQRGPFALCDLERLAAEGELSDDILVWCEGLPGWKPLFEVTSQLHNTDLPKVFDPQSRAINTPKTCDPVDGGPKQEIPPMLMSRIRERVKREYGDDAEAERLVMQNQIDSYRSLQGMVAQPPNGLNGASLAKIIGQAQREHPFDLQLQLHAVEEEIEAHAKVEYLTNSANDHDVPSDILNKIVLKARREYPISFTRQLEEMQEQVSCYLQLIELRKTNGEEMEQAIADVERDYPEDFAMQFLEVTQKY